MKKLTYLISAVAAGLFSSAHADVSVSGSAGVAYQSAGSDTALHSGGAVTFGLSTTTASGMTISTGAGISNSVTNGNTTGGAGAGGAVTGFKNLTFATGGVTLTVGSDIDLPDGVGEVGGLVSDVTIEGSAGITSATGLTDDEGAGVSVSTSLGEAALSLFYVADSALDGNGEGDIDGASGTGSGVSISTAVGQVGLTVAYATHSDTGVDDTETAAAASYAMGGAGTISAGYTTSTGTNDGNSFGLAYSMNLDADTSLGIGYQSHDVNSNSGRATDVTISRAMGGGMSVYAELRNTSGDTDAGENSTMAIGTSVSF